jgi:hypothetical protein
MVTGRETTVLAMSAIVLKELGGNNESLVHGVVLFALTVIYSIASTIQKVNHYFTKNSSFFKTPTGRQNLIPHCSYSIASSQLLVNLFWRKNTKEQTPTGRHLT